MKKILFPALLVAAAFTACSSDDDPSTDSPRKMTVVVSETPLIPEGDEARQMDVTRTAAATTTASLSAFSMNYTGSKYDFTKTGSEWKSDAGWPDVANDQKLDFFAYTAGTFNWNAVDPYLNYTVEEDAFSQKDVLVATANTSYNDHHGIVPLTFSHACAAVKVNVFLSNTLKSKLGGKLMVNSIVMRQVKKTGAYHYNSRSWTDVNSLTFYTLTNGNFEVDTDQVPLPCGYLFLIPQTLGEGAQFDVTYNTDKHAYIPLSGTTWQAGYEYTMNIKLTTSLIK